MAEESIDFSGNVAQRLLSSGGNIQSLRINTTLRDDEWEQIDQTVLRTFQERLTFIPDMIAAGMTFPLSNPLGTLVVEHEKVGEMTSAEVSMDGVTRDNNDRVVYKQVQTPVPLIHKPFQVTVRNLEASRRRGDMLDTTSVAAASRQVNETLEIEEKSAQTLEELAGLEVVEVTG